MQKQKFQCISNRVKSLLPQAIDIPGSIVLLWNFNNLQRNISPLHDVWQDTVNYNTIHVHIAKQWQVQGVYQTINSQRTLHIIDKLWSAFSEYFGEKLPWYEKV